MSEVKMRTIHDISRIYEGFMDLEAWPRGWDLGVLPPCCPPAAPALPPVAGLKSPNQPPFRTSSRKLEPGTWKLQELS